MSTLFFIIAFFSLFCTGNGMGIFACITYLILGGLLKAAENGAFRPKTKIDRRDWWYEKYKNWWGCSTFPPPDNINYSHYDENARCVANTSCKAYGGIIPPKDEQERFARTLGIKTKQSEIEKKAPSYYATYLIKEFKKQLPVCDYNTNPNSLRFKQRDSIILKDHIEKEIYKSFKICDIEDKDLPYTYYDFFPCVGEDINTYLKYLPTQQRIEIEQYCKEFFKKEINYLLNKKKKEFEEETLYNLFYNGKRLVGSKQIRPRAEREAENERYYREILDNFEDDFNKIIRR